MGGWRKTLSKNVIGVPVPLGVRAPGARVSAVVTVGYGDVSLGARQLGAARGTGVIPRAHIPITGAHGLRKLILGHRKQGLDQLADPSGVLLLPEIEHGCRVAECFENRSALLFVEPPGQEQALQLVEGIT